MFECKIRNRKTFKTKTFYSDGSSIWVDENGKERELGLQLCESGKFAGNAISLKKDATEKDFKYACRRWYNARSSCLKREFKRLKKFSDL